MDPSNPWLVVGSALSGQSELPKVPPSVETETKVPEDKDTGSEEQTEQNENQQSKTTELEGEKDSGEEEESSSDESEEEEEGGGEGGEENKESADKTKGSSVIVREVPSLEQEMLVDMAFANDDVVAQFKEEKDKTVDEETEKVWYQVFSL